jgi:glutathione S-transferase
LVTIPISHYCEKARWALERAGIPYREERHVQAVHRFAAKRAGGGSTVPVLVTPEGSIGESEKILDWVDARTPPEFRLQPADAAAKEETMRLTRRFDEVLGPRGRRLMYVNMLQQRELMLSFNNQGVPAWENRFMRAGFPLAVRWAHRALGIRPGVEDEDEAIVWQEFDYVAELLSDGRPYLVTDRFSAADLTWAALCASIIVPPIYGVPLPQPDVLPADIAEVINKARAHPAGAFALDLYEKHRRERIGDAVAA